MLSSFIAPFMLSVSLYTDYKALLLPPIEEVTEEEVINYIEVVATFYTARCKGCTGITKTGHDVKKTIYEQGKRVIAVDPAVIPLRSLVLVELENGDSFEAIASDIGGSIKKARIDVLVKTESEAFELGRQNAKITILEEIK